ncbi:MAG: hypothetical protein ISS94_05145 [Candidatus Syntrophoarchaeum sp.]|nr:hypothetical protein [Candidatus Syntrophoarchaeum sp.]
MKSLVDKFRTIEKTISEEKGSFVLFALFVREEAQDKWDLVLSANWFADEKRKILDYLVEKIKDELAQDITEISRIILLRPSDQFVKTVNSIINIEHGDAEVVDSRFDEYNIKHAYIITSKS